MSSPDGPAGGSGADATGSSSVAFTSIDRALGRTPESGVRLRFRHRGAPEPEPADRNVEPPARRPEEGGLRAG